MMLQAPPNIFQIAHPGAIARHAKIQSATIEKLRTKRITCTTCDGKGCVGRCKFRKPH